MRKDLFWAIGFSLVLGAVALSIAAALWFCSSTNTREKSVMPPPLRSGTKLKCSLSDVHGECIEWVVE